MSVSARHDERTELTQFMMYQSNGVLLGIVRTKRIRADKFGKTFGLMSIRFADRAHFVEDDGQSGLCDLPGSL